MGTLFDARITQVAPAQDDIQAVCVDGTYAWFAHAGNGGFISRVRQTDGVMVKADGSVGDYNTARRATSIAGSRAIATNGTYVGVSAVTTQYARFYNNSDMGYAGDAIFPTWGDCYQAIYAYGYFWFPISGYMCRVTPGTWAVNYVSTGLSGGYNICCATGDGYVWATSNSQYIKKIRASDNVVVATVDLGGGVSLRGLATDGTYLYLVHWANPTTYVYKMRISDGLFWKNDYSGWTSVIGQGAFPPPLWEGLYGYLQAGYADGFLYVGNQLRGIIMRYATDVMSQAGWINVGPAGRVPAGSSGAAPFSFAYDGTRIWTSNSLAVPSYVTSFETLVAPATLTNVDPAAGPKIRLTFDTSVDAIGAVVGAPTAGVTVTGVTQVNGTTVDLGLTPTVVPALVGVAPMAGPKVRLAFDNPVIATAPTIGAATAGLGITSVAQVDGTTVDLNTDYPPVHPLGEAEDITLAPPAGGGASLL